MPSSCHVNHEDTSAKTLHPQGSIVTAGSGSGYVGNERICSKFRDFLHVLVEMSGTCRRLQTLVVSVETSRVSPSRELFSQKGSLPQSLRIPKPFSFCVSY